ncbi:MAG: HU family DNA-binding protein [Akkermansia sp.]
MRQGTSAGAGGRRYPQAGGTCAGRGAGHDCPVGPEAVAGEIRGFGTFRVKHRRARIVRHPENGSKLFVHESSTMKFRPSSRLWKK